MVTEHKIYRGHDLCYLASTGLWEVSKDNIAISYSRSEEEAMKIVDEARKRELRSLFR